MSDSSNKPRSRTTYSVSEDRGYESPCWIWQGFLNQHGYGESHASHSRWGTRLVHRANFMERHGSISRSQKLENLCQTGRCVNPDHWQIKKRESRPSETATPPSPTEPEDAVQPTLFTAERTRLCRGCSEEKPFSEFWNHPGCTDGLRPQCKDCIRQYNYDNRERRRAMQQLWQERNRDKVRAANRKSTQKRKQEKPWLIHDQNARNREKFNPELNAKSERKRRARVAGALGDGATLSELIAIHGSRCYLCQSSPATEVEHMTPLVRGGSNRPENLRPCCRSCNSSKGNKTYREYLDYLQLPNLM